MAVKASKEVVLGLCVNADTYEEEAEPPDRLGAAGSDGPKTQQEEEEEEDLLHRPFDVSVLGRYDFRLRPTNFKPGYKTLRAPAILDFDDVAKWYHGSNLLAGAQRLDYVARGLRCTPNDPPRATEPVVCDPVELDDEEALRTLREKAGVNLRPLRVEADGSCLVHAVSTALTGSQVYFDALRWAAHKELRDHRAFYERAGLVTAEDKARLLPRLEAAAAEAAALGLVDREKSMRVAAEEVRRFGAAGGPTANARPKWTAQTVEEAVEKARPSEGQARGQAEFLEEVHIAALSNVLRRPIIVLAEGFQGGLFLPLRHHPEDCRLPDGRANPPLFIYQQLEHYVPLCPQDGRDFWAWAEHEAFPGDQAALAALRKYEAARGGGAHRVPEWVEEIVLYVVSEVAARLEGYMRTYEIPEGDKEEYRRAFGHPEQMAPFPLAVVFEEAPVRCTRPLKNVSEMNAVFATLGFKVEGAVEEDDEEEDDDWGEGLDGDAATQAAGLGQYEYPPDFTSQDLFTSPLPPPPGPPAIPPPLPITTARPSIRLQHRMRRRAFVPAPSTVNVTAYIHKIDFAKAQRMLFGLYWLMSSQHFSAGPLASPTPPAALTDPLASFAPSSPLAPPPPLLAAQEGNQEGDGDGDYTISSDGADAGGDESQGEIDSPSRGRVVPAAPAPTAPAAPAPVVTVGVLPCAGNADQVVWKFVLNWTQNDDLNLGVARLYCDPEGWDLRPLTDPGRDPRGFLLGEWERLERRFQALTGLDLRHLAGEEQQQQQPQQQLAHLGPLGGGPPAELPKALVALQAVMRSRPYPGRGGLQPGQITISDAPSSLLALTKATSTSSTPAAAPTAAAGDAMEVASSASGAGRDVSLGALGLPTAEARRALLAELLQRGLPQNVHFEQAALATLLPERWPEPRARFAFAEWLANAAEAGGANIGVPVWEVERSPDAPYVMRRVVLRPLAQPRPLPRLAVLFPSSPATTSGPAAEESMPARPTNSASSSSASSASSASSTSTAHSCPRSPSPEAERDSGVDEAVVAVAATAPAVAPVTAPMAVVGEARLHSVANGGRSGTHGANSAHVSLRGRAGQQGEGQGQDDDDDLCGRSPCSKRLASWPLATHRGGSDGGGGCAGASSSSSSSSNGATPAAAIAPAMVQRGASNPF